MSQKYSRETLIRAWEMAQVIPHVDSTKVRKDRCGAVISFNEYGNRNSRFGWEIDHIFALAKGGADTWDNVQPLHWDNNCTKGDGPLVCSTNPTNQ